MFGLCNKKELDKVIDEVKALYTKCNMLERTVVALERLLKEEAIDSGKNKRWSRSEEDMIHKAVISKTTVNTLATLLDRTADAIRTRAISLGYKTQYDLLVTKGDK